MTDESLPVLPLTYLLRRPAPADDGARPPLLILLHGVGSNERSMAQLAPAFDRRFLVLVARSPLVLGPDSFAWFRVRFTAAGPEIDAAEARAAWTLLARFIDEAVSAFGADPARVFIAGFSQGGIMSLAGLLTTPDRIAAAVMMSGRLLPEVLPHAASAARLKGKPLLIVHGTADEVLGIEYGRSARDKVTPLGVELTYQEFPMVHQVTPESLAVVTRWLSARLG